MDNIIIVIVLLLIVGMAIVPTIKHFKGQGGCCGGGSYKPKKKKLKSIAAVKTFQIEGMHCENCSNRVMEAINDISGVSAVVNHKKGIATISYENDVDDSQVCDKIKKAGYNVVNIK